MDSITVKISKDFAPTPGPRYKKEGKWSGQLFRETIFFDKVNQAIKEKKKLIVDLDGTTGFGTSFLEESFGGLIREHNLDYNKILKVLTIISKEESYLSDDIFHYLKDAYEKKITDL